MRYCTADRCMTLTEYRQMDQRWAELSFTEERSRWKSPRGKDFKSGFIPAPFNDGEYG